MKSDDSHIDTERNTNKLFDSNYQFDRFCNVNNFVKPQLKYRLLHNNSYDIMINY